MVKREQIQGKVGQFILDPIACRHLVLLLDDTEVPTPAEAPAAGASIPAADDDTLSDRLSSMVGRGSPLVSPAAVPHISL